jgi:hypothetical protein
MKVDSVHAREQAHLPNDRDWNISDSSLLLAGSKVRRGALS